jgi:hypothetical protein
VALWVPSRREVRCAPRGKSRLSDAGRPRPGPTLGPPQRNRRGQASRGLARRSADLAVTDSSAVVSCGGRTRVDRARPVPAKPPGAMSDALATVGSRAVRFRAARPMTVEEGPRAHPAPRARQVLQAAADLDPAVLRGPTRFTTSAQAREDLHCVVTYDRRMSDAARGLGCPCVRRARPCRPWKAPRSLPGARAETRPLRAARRNDEALAPGEIATRSAEARRSVVLRAADAIPSARVAAGGR